MFVILVYDVNVKRTAKVLKTVRSYLSHLQRSVFEGELTEKELEELKSELEDLIKPSEDTVLIYTFDSLRYSHRHRIGRQLEDRDII